MDDSLISLYIDDELDLDEKIVFVETTHASADFSRETIALLRQEKLLRQVPAHLPLTAVADLPGKRHVDWAWFFRFWWQPMAGFATAVVLMAAGFLLVPWQSPTAPPHEQRFVLYLPQAGQAKIVGTFTDWNPLPMQKIGKSGYWSLNLKVPPGVHRYSYLIEESNRMADPTVAAREHDDFGGENSVIVVGADIEPIS